MSIFDEYEKYQYKTLLPSVEINITENMVRSAKEGDAEAITLIIQGFLPFIFKESSRYPFIDGYDKNDLIQVGILSLLKALEKFSLDKFQSFTFYHTSAIRNNYACLCRQHNINRVSLSLNANADSGDSNVTFLDLLEDLSPSIEDISIKEDFEKALQAALPYLPEEERHIFQFFSETTEKYPLKTYSSKYNIPYRVCCRRKERLILHLRNLLKAFL